MGFGDTSARVTTAREYLGMAQMKVRMKGRVEWASKRFVLFVMCEGSKH